MLPSIFETCIPREEILAGELSVDLFAAKLRSVVEGKAPLIYQDAASFFANTFATDGIKTLIREVFSRLTGKSSGSPVIRLETSFGGASQFGKNKGRNIIRDLNSRIMWEFNLVALPLLAQIQN